MEMQFINKAMMPLSDFALMVNKNTFSLMPAHALDIRGTITPGQSLDSNLVLKIDGLSQLSTPVNSKFKNNIVLQVAIKTNLGVNYFQCAVPLYVLFAEATAMAPQVWLRMWGQEIPSANESIKSFECNNSGWKQKLMNNNVVIVADRDIDGAKFSYGHVKLEDGSLFLVEFKVEGRIQVTTKTYSMHLIGLFQDCISDLLAQ